MAKRYINYQHHFHFDPVADEIYMRKMKERKKKRQELNLLKTPSQLQLVQRQKFVAVSKFLSWATEAVNIGYATAYKKQHLSKRNLAARVFMRDAFVYDNYPFFKLDFSRILISQGRLKAEHDAKLSIADDGKLNISWSNPDFENPTDKAMFFIYNERTESGLSYLDAAVRGNLSADIHFPYKIKGDVLHCWMFLAACKGKETSNSVYMKEVF